MSHNSREIFGLRETVAIAVSALLMLIAGRMLTPTSSRTIASNERTSRTRVTMLSAMPFFPARD